MTVLHQVLVLLHAGRWNEAHNLVQSDASELAAWLHGILHIQEGDLEDAEYWYGKASRHFRSRGSLTEELERFEAALPRGDGPVQWATCAGADDPPAPERSSD